LYVWKTKFRRAPKSLHRNIIAPPPRNTNAFVLRQNALSPNGGTQSAESQSSYRSDGCYCGMTLMH
jgi:hypothetical protein